MQNQARDLRRALTVSERRLWNWLRNRSFSGYKFRRQFAVDRFVLDFYCPELALAIEVDEKQHGQRPVAECDDRRAQRLNALGIRVERIPNVLLANDSLLVEQQIRFWIEQRAASRR